MPKQVTIKTKKGKIDFFYATKTKQSQKIETNTNLIFCL